MKLNRIVAACAALGAASAFAATALPATCPTTPGTAADLVSNCAPEVAFYFVGASAQEPAVKAIMNTGGNGIFDTAKPIVRVVSTAANTLTGVAKANHGAAQSTAWYGFGAAGTAVAGKRIAAIYNKVNGSGAGQLQLLSGGGVAKLAGLENSVLTIQTQDAKSAAKGIVFTSCSITADSVTAGGDVVTDTATCSNAGNFFGGWSGQKIAHLSLTDVDPLQLDPSLGIKKAGGTVTKTAYQGFGVVVSPALYAAMVTKQRDTDHTLDAACTSTSTTVACQPNINAAEYASLLAGTAKSAEFLTGVANDPITVARRVKFSGTQAASNIFFMNQAGYNAKAALSTFVAPISTADGTAGTATTAAGSFVTTTVNAGTGDVKTAVQAATGNVIGVVSLENTAADMGTAKFVKLNGFSPDADAAGNLASSNNRYALQAGYPFQYLMAATEHAKAAAMAEQHFIAGKIVTALKDAATSDLKGIAYTDTTTTSKATVFERINANNYSPLARK